MRAPEQDHVRHRVAVQKQRVAEAAMKTLS